MALAQIFGFRRVTMASSGVGLYHGLWWSYAHDPAHRRDPDTMGDAAICWVKAIRPPQPEKIDADGTLFFRDFFNGMIGMIIEL